jgi:hypothetical protein
MRTIGSTQVEATIPALKRSYEDEGIAHRLSQLAGTRMIPLKDRNERMVLNILEQDGDTHGAHRDSFDLALNIILDSPARGAGGLLEYSDSHLNPEDFEKARATALWLRAGDGYLMESIRLLHRVCPLRSGRRISLSMAYATPERAHAPQPSSEILYGLDPAA